MDLFEKSKMVGEPLAARMRPRNLKEYIGQSHILGEGKLLRRLIQADRMSSLIFYGPPGTGKTTLASVIANSTESRFVILNAVLSGVKQLRDELDEAARQQKMYSQRTILFIDEVHRWNKSQQDALLPWVENGTIVLIGATTENPYFEVNPALVSRSRVFRLKKLNEEEMRQVALQAISDKERGYGQFDVQIDEDALTHLVKTADGDARNLLNALELAVETTPASFPPPIGTTIPIHLETAEQSIQQKAVLYDKEGDYHYDVISAFIKSIRGSDPDAVLYWLARMIQAGEEPRFIFRRMMISACEDIGLADPNALKVVVAAAEAFDRVGLPEGRFMLSQAALYLATAEKSNSNLGFFDALDWVGKERTKEVPNHLKDQSRDSEAFGHGKGYLYPHAFKDHWVAQQYLPTALQGRIFYHPSHQGYEDKIRAEVLRKREIQLEVGMAPEYEENYSWSPENRKLSQWIQRAEQGKESSLILRDALITEAKLHRNDNVLIMEEGSALLYWEALRQAPEGGVYLLSDKTAIEEHILHYFKENDIDDIPLIVKGSRENLTDLSVLVKKNQALQFDSIMGRNLLSFKGNPEELLNRIQSLLSEKGKILFSQKSFVKSTQLSHLLSDCKFQNSEILAHVEQIEERMLEAHPFWKWNPEKVQNLALTISRRLTHKEIISEKKVKIEADLLSQWFNSSNSIGYGQLSEADKNEISAFLLNRNVNWKNCDIVYQLS